MKTATKIIGKWLRGTVTPGIWANDQLVVMDH